MELSRTDGQALLILTNLPDEAGARDLATMLVSRRLAACVNVLAPCHSVYRWQGAIESAQEVPLLIKTTESALCGRWKRRSAPPTPMNFPRSSLSQLPTACPDTWTGSLPKPAPKPPTGTSPHDDDPPAVPAALRLRRHGPREEPLPPEQAFRFSARVVDAKTIEARWQITDGTTCTATSSSSRWTAAPLARRSCRRAR
jgi:uncharacterized protein involved in tolerance to divalent cations